MHTGCSSQVQNFIFPLERNRTNSKTSNLTLFLAKVRQEFGKGGGKREGEERGREEGEEGGRGKREGEEGGIGKWEGGVDRLPQTYNHVPLLPKLDFPSLCRTLNFHYRLGASGRSKLELL